jgi:signal transduction histidine kinase
VLQSWLWLTGFSVCILAVLLVLQFALFNSFYYTVRRMELLRTGRAIVQAYENQKDFSRDLRQYALNRNLRILLVDGGGWILGNYDGFGTLFSINGGRMESFSQTEKELCYTVSDRQGGQVVYIARVTPSPSGERYLYVTSPIPPSDATRSVMAAQFLLITAVLLLFSAGTAWLLSKHISRPILRLTDSAKGLAKGEFRPALKKADYAEIAQLSDELLRATRELTKAEQYRRELLANVSHDLKTPLTIIKMYGEMLRDVSGDNPEKRAAHCAKVIEESDRLTSMVNELLEMSKLEQADEIAMAPVRLDLLLHETADRFHALREQRGVAFALDIAESVTVPGNAALLSRAAYNLIANALNHVGNDQTVWIRLMADSKAARVEVEDHGTGIPPEELEHIWQRYYKSSRPHQRDTAGSGLGLSIVQTALRLHHARYGVESVVGQGSVFWFETGVEQ